MTTETKEAPAQTAPAKFELKPPRTALKRGMAADDIWIVAGLPKSGKSTLAGALEGCVVLECERGGADRIQGWVQDIPDLATFRQALKAAVEEPKCKALAVDSLDVLSDWFEAEVAEQYGLESISERKEGVNGFAVWKTLREKFEGFLAYLRRSGKFVLLLAHCKEPKIDADGKVVVPAGITIPGKLGGYIAAEVDAIGNTYKKQVGLTTQYYISFQGGALGTWGSRIPELEDKTIQLPRTGQWDAIKTACVGKPETSAPNGHKDEAPKNGKKAAAAAGRK